LLGLLGSERYEVECELECGLRGEGTLWGGNLALVAHLAGTAFSAHRRRRLVSGGHRRASLPHRADALSVHFAGVLTRQRAVLLGSFTGYEVGANDNGYDAAAMVAHVRARLCPHLFTGLPFGHTPEKLTLPVGGRCALDVRDGRARLAFSGYHV
jgi:muramoyltetrapeptide carboxypeptidase